MLKKAYHEMINDLKNSWWLMLIVMGSTVYVGISSLFIVYGLSVLYQNKTIDHFTFDLLFCMLTIVPLCVIIASVLVWSFKSKKKARTINNRRTD